MVYLQRVLSMAMLEASASGVHSCLRHVFGEDVAPSCARGLDHPSAIGLKVKLDDVGRMIEWRPDHDSCGAQ